MARRLSVVLWLAAIAVQVAATDTPTTTPDALLASAAREAEAGNLTAAISTLQALEAGSTPPGVQRQGDLLLGVLLFRQGQLEEAVSRLERAAATYPLLADYALVALAAAHRRAGRWAAAAVAVRRLLDQHPESLFVERVNRELPRDWMEAGDLARAEAAAGQYLAAFPQGPGRSEVWVTLGEVLLRSGRAEQAEEVLRRVWVELPASPESQRAKELLATIPSARPFTPEEQFQRATTLHQLGRYGQTQSELAPFAVSGNPKETQARLLLGIGSFRLRQYRQAALWLDPLKDGSGAEQVEGLYWLARSFGRSGEAPRFAELMTLLADSARQTPRGEEALYLLAQTAVDNADPALARTYLARLLQEFPKGAWTDVALWLQGWLAYKDRHPKTALAAWSRLLAEEPGSRFRVPALYWQGRVLEAEKRPKEAAKTYRTLLQTAPDQHYYWFRARERLARIDKKAVQPLASLDGDKTASMRSESLGAQKARALRGLGLNDEAADEYSEQIRKHPEDRGGLVEACRSFLDFQRYDKAVWLSGKVLRPLFVQEQGRPPIRGFWECFYPLGYWSVVNENARQQGLDPYLVTALIREESAFAPRAVSSAGARGLMQLMPQTAEQVARSQARAPIRATPLESPEVNVQLGTIHFADLLRDTGGNLTLAVASYNAGYQQVKRWRERYRFSDEEEFTEDIPYTETRNYVKRVLGSYKRYASLYGSRRAENREPSAPKR